MEPFVQLSGDIMACRVAVKCLKQQDSNAVEDFRNKILVMSNCHHDNIVKFYSACEAPEVRMRILPPQL